jgi:hypothetical protein
MSAAAAPTAVGADQGASYDHAVQDFVPDVPLTAKEMAALAELRAAVKSVELTPQDREYWSSDHALRRFLVARQQNVAAATEMYKHTMDFRKARRCGELLQIYKEPQAMNRHFPWGFVGAYRGGTVDDVS